MTKKVEKGICARTKLKITIDGDFKLYHKIQRGISRRSNIPGTGYSGYTILKEYFNTSREHRPLRVKDLTAYKERGPAWTLGMINNYLNKGYLERVD